jgi:uncharacterized protein YutE (UPF0331/DUF86 family)
MTIDKTVIMLRLNRIEKNIALIEDILEEGKSNFVNDRLAQGAAKYSVQISAQSIIDIASHMIAQNKWGAPESYADTMRILERENIIDSELAENLETLVKLKNALVHLYLKIDESRLFEDLTHGIKYAKNIYGCS